MYDFNQFSLADMISCSRTLRDFGRGSASMEETAQLAVRFFYEQFVDNVIGQPSCSMVRLFKTHSFGDLDEQLRAVAQQPATGTAWPDEMKCMVLLATAGEHPDWNCRFRSKSHQVIPLPSLELVERMPMVSHLVRQLGFDIPSVIGPQRSILLEPHEQLHGLFYIPEAKGSPYIPDQAPFVTAYGIKSVLGFGAMLPSGDLFATIIFSKVFIPEKTEQLFKPLALAVKSALVPFDGLSVFKDKLEDVPTSDGEGRSIARLKSELAAIRELLNVSDVTVREQAIKVEDTSIQLAQARDKALEASALKSAFVANISHELRTPLSGIVGLSELLLGTQLTQEQEELGLGIDESARNLLSIVNDILDFSKIEAGKIDLEVVPFSPEALVNEVARSMAGSARTRNLSIVSHINQLLPQHLLGDQARIRQVLLNLVSNAIKFTDHGEITISITAIDEDPQRISLRFSVADTGIGLSASDRSKLFVPFSQLHPARRHTGGSGLGLSICKRLTNLMGGTIGVESEPNSGSEFWFTLPLMKPMKDEKKANGSTLRWQSRVPCDSSILVVEDTYLLRALAMKQLENLGVTPTGAETGMEAVVFARAHHYDVILMDCNLPDISGFEASRMIRNDERESGHKTIIIAITALAMTGDREKCLEAGMDDYLRKPVTMEQLIEKLEYWLLKSTGDKSIVQSDE